MREGGRGLGKGLGASPESAKKSGFVGSKSDRPKCPDPRRVLLRGDRTFSGATLRCLREARSLNTQTPGLQV